MKVSRGIEIYMKDHWSFAKCAFISAQNLKIYIKVCSELQGYCDESEFADDDSPSTDDNDDDDDENDENDDDDEDDDEEVDDGEDKEDLWSLYQYFLSKSLELF